MVVYMTILKDAHGGSLDPLWAAEFCGLFWGEGYLAITTNGRLKGAHPSYALRVQLTARDDDAALIQEVASVFGGYIFRGKRRGRGLNRFLEFHTQRDLS